MQSTTNENRFIGPPLYRHNLITYIISFIRRIVKTSELFTRDCNLLNNVLIF
nr:MAG TPA: hypothetical protein [Caudoviricetes sp.]